MIKRKIVRKRPPLHWAFSLKTGNWTAYNGRYKWETREDGPYVLLFRNGNRIKVVRREGEVEGDPIDYLKTVAQDKESS